MSIEGGPGGMEGLEGLGERLSSGGGQSEPRCLLELIDAFVGGEDVEAETVLSQKLAKSSGETALVGCDLCGTKFTLVKGGDVRPWPPGCQNPTI